MSKSFYESLLTLAAAAALLFVIFASPVFGQCIQPPANMVAWWPGDGNANDVQGPTFETGTITGTATYAAGKVGQAFSFDGSQGGYAEIPDSPLLNPTSAFSVDGWFYIDPAAPGNEIGTLVGKSDGQLNSYWSIYFDNRDSSKSIRFVMGNDVSYANAVPTANWYHVAGTYDSTATPRAKLYLNGSLVADSGSAVFNVTPNNLSLRIGAMHWTETFGVGNDRLNGKADEVEFLDRAMSLSEIQAIYNAGSAGKCKPVCTPPPSNLINWWPGDGNANDVVGGQNASYSAQTYGNGKVRQGFRFGSSSAYVDVNMPAIDTSPGGKNTVEFWMYWSGDAGFNGLGSMPFGFDRYDLDLFNGTFGFNTGSGDIWGISSSGLANRWVHIAAVFVNGSITLNKLYIDGVEQTLTARFGTPGTGLAITTGRIGGWLYNTDYGLNGTIDEVKVYNRALTQYEVQAAYAAGSAGTCSAVCSRAPLNMVSWWTGNGNTNDILGRNNGIAGGSLTYVSGEVLQGFGFDGSTANVRVPASPSLDVGSRGAMTIDMWIKPTSVAPSPLAEWGTDFTGAHFWVGGNGVPGNLFINLRDTGGNHHILQSAGGIVVVNEWQHVAMTYDSATGLATLYVNGSVVAGPTNLGTFTPKTGVDLYLGLRVPTGDRFGGVMDEVELFDRALTQTELSAIYFAGSAGKCTACAVPSANMRAWWRGEDNGLDSVGTNHATLLSGTAFGPAVVRQGFILDGTNDYIKIPASASLDVGTESGFTVEAWIKPNTITGHDPLVEWSGEAGEPNGYGAHFYASTMNAGGLFANIIDTSGGYHVIDSPSGVVTPGVFQHVALTYDKSSGIAVLYKNGEVVTQSNLGIFTPKTSNNVYVGARVTSYYGDTGYRFPGTIDEIQILARALSQTEIRATYEAGSLGTCPPATELSPGCAAIPSGLTRWWRSEGNALDQRKANHASLMNGTAFAAGRSGNAFAFDGIDDYVSVPAFNMGSNWSVEGWVNLAACSDNTHCPIFVRSNGNTDGMWLGYLGAGHSWNNEFVFNIGNGTEWQIVLRPTTKYPFGSWNHVAATRNGDTYSLYINGVLRDQKTVAGVSESYQPRETRLGRWDYGTSAYMQGKIDEVSVYKRALSATDIWSIYNAAVSYGFGKCAGSQTRDDMDGDMLSDLSIFRPSGANGAEWWWLKSTGGNGAVQFGVSTDTIVASDYTGDGKTDVAFWRPSTGQWYILRSEDFSFYAFPFGGTGDIPAPADYDGDGKTDATVFRPSTSTWYINKSTGGTGITVFGATGDKPVPEDYDGDGKADIAVFRPNGTGGAEWWIAQSSGGVFATQFGQPTDKAVPADYTGDGKADIAFWMPSNGFWYVLRSDDYSYYAFPFGGTTDVPVPADYDGDARVDAGVFRSSNSNWYISRSTAGLLIQQFGSAGDVPVPNAFVR